MKIKKKKKVVRMRGTRTHGFAMKKHKGKGNKGGKGMAGTGKRADQKKTLVLKINKNYFGKKGLQKKKRDIKIINVGDIGNQLERLKAKKSGEGFELSLPNYKILGNGKLELKLMITVRAASPVAIEKIEKKGGKVTTSE